MLKRNGRSSFFQIKRGVFIIKKKFRILTALIVISLVFTMMQSIAFGYDSPYPGVSIDLPDISNLALGESITFTPTVTDKDTGKNLTANIIYEAEEIQGVKLTDSNGKRISNGNCANEPRDKSFKAPITVTRISCTDCWFGLCAYDTTGEYKGLIAAKQVEFRNLPKSKNTLTVKTKKVTVRYSKLKARKQTISVKKAFAVSKAKGTVSYKKAGSNKKITIAKNGRITIRKGLRKGNYNLKVKVRASGDDDYKSITKTVTVKIKVN